MTDLTIQKGSTFPYVAQWGVLPFVYKAISAITKAGPVAITAAGHGVPDGWPVAVSMVGGMRQLRAKHSPPILSDFHRATVVSSSVITLNDVDSTNYTAYTSGGSLMYHTPVSIAGYSARMKIRETVESTTVLASLVSPTDIALDDTAKTITITISATDTAAYTFTSGVYDLELVSAGGVVTQLLSGNVIVLDEVTR